MAGNPHGPRRHPGGDVVPTTRQPLLTVIWPFLSLPQGGGGRDTGRHDHPAATPAVTTMMRARERQVAAGDAPYPEMA